MLTHFYTRNNFNLKIPGYSSFLLFIQSLFKTRKPKSWTQLASQGGRFEIFHPFCSKSSKRLKGALWWKKKFLKKSPTMPKKLKEGPFGLVRYCMIRGKCMLRDIVCSVPWANRGNLKFCRTFGRIILVTWGVSKKKHWRKAMSIVDSFPSRKAPTRKLHVMVTVEREREREMLHVRSWVTQNSVWSMQMVLSWSMKKKVTLTSSGSKPVSSASSSLRMLPVV